MTSVMDTQKENVKKAFYAAVGTPMVAGRKFMDFSTDLFTETSLEDLESAGREVTGAIRDSKMVEQIQDSVDLIQEAKVVEQLQVKVDVDQLQERVEVLREQLETALHNWREQFTPGVAGPRPVKIDVEAETQKPKPTTAKKATPKKATPKATAKSTAKRTAPKSTAKKTAPKKTAPKKTSTEE
ncbi:MAG: hypothetical protein WBO84_02530 [Acidimicrobiia bacterium]